MKLKSIFGRNRQPKNVSGTGKRVITFGTFDLLHEGHLNILRRARNKGDHLIVGISTDALNALKGKSAMFSQDQRRSYVDALEFVDETFFEESLEAKDDYIKGHQADLLVMGDDWQGKFDWVSCDVEYLPRTENVSSSTLRTDMLKDHGTRRVLFCDTYIKKHYDCAMSIVGEMLDANIAPIFTQTRELPRNLKVDCLVYFNRPSIDPPVEYNDVPRVCIDHGASNLKWFLASRDRFAFFDRIITAGPDHSRSILNFFPESDHQTRVHSAGFIKTPDLITPPKNTREEICRQARLDSKKPIVLFVPTWYLSRNIDMQTAISQMADVENHVTVLHPETEALDTSSLNVIENSAGLVTELMKHADCIVSDLSSTIFEAAPLRKPVVQILMREYSDNNATMFDFPYVAGTSDLFCGGVPCRPHQLRELVAEIVHNPHRYSPMMEACQQRILRGTTMDGNVADRICAELLVACRDKRVEKNDKELAKIQELGLKTVHEDLRSRRMSLIAHGGGDFNSHHASNSREAIRTALTSVNLVEVDLVKGADGIFCAHNGFEERYGLEKPFAEVTTEEFRTAKYREHLTTLTLEDFFELFKKSQGHVVFDIKDMDADYDEIAEAIKRIATELELTDRVIVQAYCKRDFETLSQLGIRKTILAVWKYYYLNPLGQEPKDFIADCLSINEHMVYGISLPYYNHHMPEPCIDGDDLLPFYAYFKRIFIHGAPQDRYPEVLRLNLGLFADGFKKGIQFKDVGGRFGWRRYLFMNPALVSEGIDNQISATCHYLDWGKKEGRKADYEVPADFSPTGYMDKNRDLRLAGISGPDTAKSHWTRFGKAESRQY